MTRERRTSERVKRSLRRDGEAAAGDASLPSEAAEKTDKAERAAESVPESLAEGDRDDTTADSKPESKAAETFEERRERLLAKARELPQCPGVYIFSDRKSRSVYIGKAINLRSRVTSYFRQNADDGRPLFPFIVRHTQDLTFLVTDSAKEALLLENSLIKQQQPRFNILLTDDKTYLSLKLTTHEDWPRLRLVRRAIKDKAQYFGPYTSASEARELHRFVKKRFGLRTCSNMEFRQRTRPCLEFQMGRCGAPCVDKQSAEDYAKIVEDVSLFLKGRNDTLVPRLEQRMREHAEKLEFETAARLRDEIRAVRSALEKRRVAQTGVFRNQDAFGIARVESTVVVRVLHVRHGNVSGSTDRKLRTELPDESVLNAFVMQFYSGGRPVPDEILLPFEIEDAELLAPLFEERGLKRVKIQIPQRGHRASLVAMAVKNAAAVLATESERQEAMQETLAALQDGLQLAKSPEIIECYDISTIQGAFTVASMVRFEHGEPRRDRFRTYKINNVEGQDDFASMREVLTRRFDPAKAKKIGPLPSLVVIDGGKGQLASAVQVIRGFGYSPEQLPVVGLAKARSKKERVSLERVYFPGRSEPVVLLQDSRELHLLARIRDAAHDHAIGYHRRLRRKKFLKSGLDEIPGVGPTRRKRLIKHFGNLKAVRAASLEELLAVDGVPESVARSVYEFFQEQSFPV